MVTREIRFRYILNICHGFWKSTILFFFNRNATALYFFHSAVAKLTNQISNSKRVRISSRLSHTRSHALLGRVWLVSRKPKRSLDSWFVYPYHISHVAWCKPIMHEDCALRPIPCPQFVTLISEWINKTLNFHHYIMRKPWSMGSVRRHQHGHRHRRRRLSLGDRLRLLPSQQLRNQLVWCDRLF